MSPGELMRRPFEVIAGMPYPNVEQVRRDVSEEHVSLHELDMSVAFARREFMENLVSLQGIRKIFSTRERQGEQ